MKDADLRDEFAGTFVADFKMGDAFRMVELVQRGRAVHPEMHFN